MSLALLAPVFLAAATMPPLRPGVSQLDSRWPEFGRVSDGDCKLTVTGDGRIFLISATGLRANEQAHFVVANGDMKPIDWRVRADSNGRFARYHLPFRWNRPGGVVSVSLRNQHCALDSSFEWRRASAEPRP